MTSERSGNLGARLLAISGEKEKKESRGVWLRDKVEELKRKHGIKDGEDFEPSEEMLRMQVTLPKWTPETPEILKEYKDPVLNWEVVRGQQAVLPTWNKEMLPEVEIQGPKSPLLLDREDKVHMMNTFQFTQEFSNEVIADSIGTIIKKELLNSSLDDQEIVTVLDNECIIR